LAWLLALLAGKMGRGIIYTLFGLIQAFFSYGAYKYTDYNSVVEYNKQQVVEVKKEQQAATEKLNEILLGEQTIILTTNGLNAKIETNTKDTLDWLSKQPVKTPEYKGNVDPLFNDTLKHLRGKK